MSDQTLTFNLHNLEPDSTNESMQKSSLSTNYATITDIQQGQNYSSGLITYNNVNLQGSEDGSYFHLMDGIDFIPMTYTLSITGGTFTSDGTKLIPNNVNAVTKKSNLAFIHNSWFKFGGIDLNVSNGVGFQHIYATQIKKERNPYLSYLDNEQESFFLDSAESFTADTIALESNNNSNISLSTPYNKAIWQRNKYFIDVTPNSTDYSNPTFAFWNTNSISQNWYPYFVNGSTQLIWYDILKIPLGDINDVYKHLPPVIRLNGFELKLQLNAGSNVSYTLTLDKSTLLPKSETVQTGNGSAFPLMLSNPITYSTTTTSGLAFTQDIAKTADVVFTLTVQIGWPNVR